jgi:hypothetical protein
MIRKLLLLLMLTPVVTLAQGVHYDGVALGPKSIPVANPVVTVCTSAGSGQPCTPLATIYTNSTLTTSAMNPLPIVPLGQSSIGAGVDALGNYGFWAAPGQYVLTITGANVQQPITLNVTIPCGPSSNCSWTGPQTFSGGIIASDGTAALPSIRFSSQANSGIRYSQSTYGLGVVGPVLVDNGIDSLGFNPDGTNGPLVGDTQAYGWMPAPSGILSGSRDTSISRNSNGVVCADTSTVGNCLGTFKAASFLGGNVPIVTSFTTTAATTDNVTVTGMTSSGHCFLQATNSGAAGGIASVYVSAKTTNQITVTHTATAGWTFDVACTPN